MSAGLENPSPDEVAFGFGITSADQLSLFRTFPPTFSEAFPPWPPSA